MGERVSAVLLDMTSSEVLSKVKSLTGMEQNLYSPQKDLLVCYSENIIYSTKIYKPELWLLSKKINLT